MRPGLTCRKRRAGSTCTCPRCGIGSLASRTCSAWTPRLATLALISRSLSRPPRRWRSTGIERGALLALIAAYAVVVAGASCWVARGLRGPEDFLMGRQGLGVAQGIGLFGGIFLGATAVGVVGQGYQRGVAGGILDLALGLGFGILSLTLLKRMRSSGHSSLVALLRAHYGPSAGVIGALVVGGAWLMLLAAFMAAAGVALEQLSGLSQVLCTAVTVVILLLYAMPGGMRAVTATNLAHLAALAVLMAVLSVLALGHAAIRTPHHQGSSSWGYLVGVLLLSAPTTVVAPDVMMGIGALRTLAAARRTLVLVVVLLTCGGLALALLGSRAEHLVSVADPDYALPRLIALLLPSGLAMGASCCSSARRLPER